MKLIVWLGNPGEKYVKTRHNIWFFFLDQFVESNSFWDFVYNNKYGWEVCIGEIPLNPPYQGGQSEENPLNPPYQGGQSGENPLFPPSQRGTEKVYFLKPMEYMNRSWNAVGKIMNFYKIDAKDLLVIHDDIDLMVWKVQFKFWWGLAGHNWLKDIAEKLWTKDFARIRIWVDRPAIQSQVSDYVLSSFKKEEIEKIQDRYLDFEKIVFEFLNS